MHHGDRFDQLSPSLLGQAVAGDLLHHDGAVHEQPAIQRRDEPRNVDTLDGQVTEELHLPGQGSAGPSPASSDTTAAGDAHTNSLIADAARGKFPHPDISPGRECRPSVHPR